MKIKDNVKHWILGGVLLFLYSIASNMMYNDCINLGIC